MSKGERTRQEIIQKTAHIFNEKGYAGTSMNDIMDATGYTKGCIYGNFENKDEIALAAFDHNFAKVSSVIRSKMVERKTSIDKLLVYPEIYSNFLKTPFIVGGCPLLNTSTDADDTHPLLKEKTANALLFWKTSIEKIIEHGINEKEIKANTKGSEFAIILTALIEGAIMQAKITNRSTELEVTMTFLNGLIMNLKV